LEIECLVYQIGYENSVHVYCVEIHEWFPEKSGTHPKPRPKS